MEQPMAKSARKTAKTARPKARAKPSPSDPKAALREALLRMVAAGGWRDLSYADIAKDAGLSLAAAYEAYPSKGAILTGIGRDIDARLFASLEDDPLDGSAKDRLFDLLMRRFDARLMRRWPGNCRGRRSRPGAWRCSCGVRSPTCWRRPGSRPPGCAAPSGSRG
jgi:AcrR family transcriptional regulator